MFFGEKSRARFNAEGTENEKRLAQRPFQGKSAEREEVLSSERDDALPAAEGGSALFRVARAAKWIAPAAAGAIAVKASR